MPNKDVERIKGLYAIIQHGHYIVLYGKKLIICNDEGDVIACRNELRNVHKVIAVSQNEILVDCGPQKAYIVLSLEDGSELWRVPYPKLDYTSRSFTISQDSAFVYDYYDFNDCQYLVRIDLKAKSLTTTRLDKGLRCVSDLICDSNGVPCLLEHHYEIVDEKHISLNRIRKVCDESVGMGSAYYWRDEWCFDFPVISLFFLGDTETVLTNNLQVYCPKNGDMYTLIKKEDKKKIPANAPFDWKTTPNKQYIILIYDEMNVVVDIKTRSIVARYRTDFYHGCLIGDCFWVSSNDGIIKKPFPLIEDIPQKTYDFWNPWASK